MCLKNADAPGWHVKRNGHDQGRNVKYVGTDRKITRNTHVKYESPSPYGSKVMINVKFLPQTDRKKTDIQATH